MSQSAPRPSWVGDSTYRACAIDKDGLTLSAVEVEAAHDAAAIWIANALSELYPVALWQGERFLGCFLGDEAMH